MVIFFVSKEPHSTLWIEIQFPSKDRPTRLIEGLAGIGFRSEVPPVPPLSGVQTIDLVKEGTGIFGSWTPEEYRVNMREARALLRSYGFRNVPRKRLTPMDLL